MRHSRSGESADLGELVRAERRAATADAEGIRAALVERLQPQPLYHVSWPAAPHPEGD